jgi:polyferredoxin
VVEQGTIENVYRLQIMNGTEQAQDYTVTVSGLPGLAIATSAQVHVGPTGIGTMPVRLTLPATESEAYMGRSNPIVFEITAQQGAQSKVAREKSTFFVPR